jgi:sulfate transport system permease protein
LASRPLADERSGALGGPTFGGRASGPPPARLGAPGSRLAGRAGLTLGNGLIAVYLSVLVLLPIAALVAQAGTGGISQFWQEVSAHEAVAGIELTVASSAIVACLNAIFGTLTAWVLVRDSFPGRRVLDSLIDLPFALPTIVAGLVLLALYGKGGPTGIDITFTRAAVVLALLFVTFPFVVRSVQPVLIDFDRSMEEAAESLGARRISVFLRVVLPNLTPAILSGAALSFARALGEYGSIVLISGNIPFKTEVASVYVFNQVSDENFPGASAVSIVLLLAALVVLAATTLVVRRRSRHVR